MGMFDRLFGKKEPQDLDALTEKFGGQANDSASEAAPGFLSKLNGIAKIEYPADGDLQKLRLVITRGAQTDEKVTLRKLGDIIDARCKTAKFVKFGQTSVNNDAIAILGAQAALDAKTMVEDAGVKVIGYNDAKHHQFSRAAATVSEQSFPDFLRSNNIPIPQIHKDSAGKFSMVTIPIIDPIVARGVVTYLEEIAEQNHARAEVQQYVKQGVGAVELSGDAVKYLQTLLSVDQYEQKRRQDTPGKRPNPPAIG